jgi:hypothetical protein
MYLQIDFGQDDEGRDSQSELFFEAELAFAEA